MLSKIFIILNSSRCTGYKRIEVREKLRLFHFKKYRDIKYEKELERMTGS